MIVALNTLAAVSAILAPCALYLAYRFARV